METEWEWDDDDDDEFYDEGDGESDEWVLACGYPDCCMPGYHYRSECHNGADIEAMNAEFEAENQRTNCTCTFGDGALFHLPDCPMREPSIG